ncbi:MAG: SGNH/GDSL hydrolase family protein [Clostridia bacterium]|nr:SGNH/GDSL hydrolase family protein [Clostridia bacterium]
MKKLIAIVLSICVIAASLAVLAACKKDTPPEDQKMILFLGDSIAEGVAGPSPIECRADYSYYAILGEINGYEYHNRAVSGHQTGQLLDYISRETEDAYLTNSLIARADIISISITGNDFLWNNFPAMMYELVAKETLGDGYADEQIVQDCYIYHRYATYRNEQGQSVALRPGAGISQMNRCLDTAYANICSVVDRIRSLNPDVVILIQNVYNMVDDDSELLPHELAQALYELDPAYDYSTAAGVAKFREVAGEMLDLLSGIIERYDTEHPGQIEVVNVKKAFGDIYDADHARGSRLVYVDGLHPSNEGHAVIASAIQAKLVELGLAKADTLQAYKSLCAARLSKLYTEVYGFDVLAARNALNQATTMDGVTKAYFDATEGVLPVLSDDPTLGRQTNGVAVPQETSFKLSGISMGEDDSLRGITQLLDLVFPDYERHFTLHTDGTADLVVSAPLAAVLGLLGSNLQLGGTILGGEEDTYYRDENGNLIGLKMSGDTDTYHTLVEYANALFPGVDFEGGHIGRNFSMLYGSLGLKLEGAECLFEEPYVDQEGLPLQHGTNWEIDPDTVGARYESYLDYVVAYMSRFSEVVDGDDKTLHVDRLPLGLEDKLREVETLTIRFTTVYSLVELTDMNGNPVHAVYLGRYNANTSPWLVLTLAEIPEDPDDEESPTITRLSMRVEVLGLAATFDLVEPEEE